MKLEKNSGEEFTILSLSRDDNRRQVQTDSVTGTFDSEIILWMSGKA